MTENNNKIEASLYKKLSNFFGNPLVGFIGTLASIIGLVLAVIFWQVSIEVPKLSYIIDPVRISVVKMGEASDLKVFYRNKEVTGDISTVQVSICNEGKKPIKGEDILSRITIEISDQAPILEAKIVKLSREVTNLSLDTIYMAQGKIGISWKVLEKNDNATIQIVYNGNPDLQVQVKGIILGQNDPINLTRSLKVINNPRERYKWDITDFRSLGILAMIPSLLSFMVSFLFLYPGIFLSIVAKKTKFSRNMGLTFLLSGISFLFIGIWVLSLRLSSPFNP